MNNKPRKPWLAGLLTLLIVGFGHFYAGNARKGIILYLGQALILAVCLPLLIFKTNIFTFSFALISWISYLIFCLVDAIKVAKINSHSYTPKKYNKWYFYLACFILANVIIQPIVEVTIKQNTIKVYKIPSGAMIPTLLIGDHIFVNRFIYKNNKPQRGDIIVFEFPKDPSKDFVKRLVGVEGDIVEIRNKKLFINNIEQIENYIINKDTNVFPLDEQPRDNLGPITVPGNKLFFMGDNRDNSYDSRFWGFVSADKIRGKVVSIYWSWDLQYPLFSLKRLRSIRWNRIGKSTQELIN